MFSNSVRKMEWSIDNILKYRRGGVWCTCMYIPHFKCNHVFSKHLQLIQNFQNTKIFQYVSVEDFFVKHFGKLAIYLPRQTVKLMSKSNTYYSI